ncbi:hypothetical protein MPSEU_000500900 [Mayamaea pseudoterrestris]|nr:hypothetical protein MPSEU_000500900 [Mayamaea pseudoterrestris]
MYRSSSLLFLSTFFVLVFAESEVLNDAEDESRYGVDYSWPMHHGAHANALSHDDSLLPRPIAYQRFMKGCYEHYSKELCIRNEEERIAHNLRQPMQQTNFTSAGYAKMKVPTQAFNILRAYWNYHNVSQARMELWDAGNVYVNHWHVPTTIVPLDSLSLANRRIVADQLKSVLEQWTQTTLVPTSTYGIRVYHRGALLSPHVDRLPLVISAIVNVAQAGAVDGEDHDWPLEVIGHDGVARNLTLEPGEMILYESHSVIHGRPQPLAMEYYANVFFHFEPLHYSQEMEHLLLLRQPDAKKRTAKELFELAFSKLGGSPPRKHASATKIASLPDYIHEGTEEAKRWRQNYIFYREEPKQDKRPPTRSKAKGVTPAHVKAANGSVEDMKKILAKNPDALHQSDANGWKPLHEAARGGNTEVVAFLLRKGASVNDRTNSGRGANALWWAKQSLEDDHPVIKLLERNGGVAIGPNE